MVNSLVGYLHPLKSMKLAHDPRALVNKPQNDCKSTMSVFYSTRSQYILLCKDLDRD